jgi:hypothetical protein
MPRTLGELARLAQNASDVSDPDALLEARRGFMELGGTQADTWVRYIDNELTRMASVEGMADEIEAAWARNQAMGRDVPIDAIDITINPALGPARPEDSITMERLLEVVGPETSPASPAAPRPQAKAPRLSPEEELRRLDEVIAKTLGYKSPERAFARKPTGKTPKWLGTTQAAEEAALRNIPEELWKQADRHVPYKDDPWVLLDVGETYRSPGIVVPDPEASGRAARARLVREKAKALALDRLDFEQRVAGKLTPEQAAIKRLIKARYHDPEMSGRLGAKSLVEAPGRMGGSDPVANVEFALKDALEKTKEMSHAGERQIREVVTRPVSMSGWSPEDASSLKSIGTDRARGAAAIRELKDMLMRVKAKAATEEAMSKIGKAAKGAARGGAKALGPVGALLGAFLAMPEVAEAGERYGESEQGASERARLGADVGLYLAGIPTIEDIVRWKKRYTPRGSDYPSYAGVE